MKTHGVDVSHMHSTHEVSTSSDNFSLQNEFQSDNIEKVNVNASEAFKKFKGKNLESEGVDFSDRISKSRRTGYDIPGKTEYELVSFIHDSCVSQRSCCVRFECHHLSCNCGRQEFLMIETPAIHSDCVSLCRLVLMFARFSLLG